MKTFKTLSTTALLLAASTTYAASEADIQATSVTEPTVAAAPTADTVIIRVNGESITQGEIDSMVKMGLQQFQARGQAVVERVLNVFMSM